MLKHILIKTTEQKVLTYLLKYSGGFLYNKEIAQKLGINETASSAALRKMYQQGILINKKIGRYILYAINEDNPFVDFLKSYSAIMELESLVNDLKHYSKKIVVFGSVAKGLYSIEQESDLDLFIISNQKEKVKEIINLFIQRDKNSLFAIKPIIRTNLEFVKMQKKDKVFLNQIDQGITLYKKDYE